MMKETPLAEELKSAINLLRDIKMKHFSIDYETMEVARIIYHFYVKRVKERNREFILDTPTKENIMRMAEILTDSSSPRFGVVLCGSFGNGKTTMLYAVRDAIHHFFNQGIISKHDFRSTIYLLGVKDVITRAQDDIGYRELKTIDILMIDDMGTEPKEIMYYGSILTPITDILEARYNLMKYTFVTTNLSPKEVSEKYGPRLADRFREMFHIIGYDHPSYRI